MSTLLSVQRLTRSFAGHVVLEGVTFDISDGDRLALIGRNGAGKSTLLKLMAGVDAPDDGAVVRMPPLRLAYLAQQATFAPGRTVLATMEAETGKPSWACAKMAARFGLGPDTLAKDAASLSGGWQMRLQLSIVFLKDPNLILMDEPTNYLDVATQLALEAWLKIYPGAVVIASHDREFLVRTCRSTMEIERGRATRFDGDVEAFLEWKAEQEEDARRHNRKLEVQVRHWQEFVDRFRYKASKAVQAQDRLKKIAKAKAIDIARPLKTARIAIPRTAVPGGTALRMQKLVVGYDGKKIAGPVDAEFIRGQHIAIVGENGQGKTTLLKTLAGILPPVDGHARWGHNLRIAFYAQFLHETLDPQATVGTWLRAAAGGHLTPDVLRMAGNFLFSIEDLDKTISVLSGGEKARLCLARLLLDAPDALLLDEPTNHLDMETAESLAAALKEWNGTVFFVTHDRTFAALLAAEILEVGGGAIRHYPGTFEEYVWAASQASGLKPDIDEALSQAAVPDANAGRKERYEQLKRLRNKANKLEKEFEELGERKRRLLSTYEANPFDVERDRAVSTLTTLIVYTEGEWMKTLEEIQKAELG